MSEFNNSAFRTDFIYEYERPSGVIEQYISAQVLSQTDGDYLFGGPKPSLDSAPNIICAYLPYLVELCLNSLVFVKSTISSS